MESCAASRLRPHGGTYSGTGLMHLAVDILHHHELLGDDMHLLTGGVRDAWPLYFPVFPRDLLRFESGSGHHASCGSSTS